MTFALLTLPFLLAGFALPRAPVLLAPPVVWAGFFAGASAGWWGHGLGDGWPFALAALAGASVCAAAVGLALRRLAARRHA